MIDISSHLLLGIVTSNCGKLGIERSCFSWFVWFASGDVVLWDLLAPTPFIAHNILSSAHSRLMFALVPIVLDRSKLLVALSSDRSVRITDLSR
jgi:hypothetical protein